MTHTRRTGIEPQYIAQAVQVLQVGGIVGFPTDTVYGVGAHGLLPAAVERLYVAKRRPRDKAIPLLVAGVEALAQVAVEIPEAAYELAERFWPGALTLILPKGPGVPPELSPYPTIGVRMPDLDFTLKLLQATGPLATTSANLSGGPNPTTADNVREQLQSRPDLILDGGPTPGPTASTVLDVSGGEMKVLRQGPITLAAIQLHLNPKENGA